MIDFSKNDKIPVFNIFKFETNEVVNPDHFREIIWRLRENYVEIKKSILASLGEINSYTFYDSELSANYYLPN